MGIAALNPSYAGCIATGSADASASTFQLERYLAPANLAYENIAVDEHAALFVCVYGNMTTSFYGEVRRDE